MPAATAESRLEISRSVFLTRIVPVESETSARSVIASVRNSYPDARHHCSAFIIHCNDATPIERSNDDGEPSGTAGGPMLETLRGNDVVNAVAVVTRYFGGIKLGTGGLVRAYSGAVSAALETARYRYLRTVVRGLINTDPGTAAQLINLLDSYSVVPEVSWGEQAKLSLSIQPDLVAQLDNRVAEITRGTTHVQWLGESEVFD